MPEKPMYNKKVRQMTHFCIRELHLYNLKIFVSVLYFFQQIAY